MISSSGSREHTLDISHLVGRFIAPAEARPRWLRYGLAIVLPCLGFVVNWQAFSSQRAPYFALFMVSVVITSLFGGTGPGLVDTALSSILGVVVAAPAWTFRLYEHEDAIRIVVFTVFGFLISVLVGVVGQLYRRLDREHMALVATLEQVQEAERTRRKLAKIVETSDDAIISKDLNGIVTSWNPAAEKMFGYTAEEMIGISATTIIPPELQDDEERLLASIAQGQRVNHIETIRLTRSGERLVISLTMSPVQDQAGAIIGVAKILRDITLRKKAERALNQSERLASVGRLATTVAHEINNPLEAVTNLVYLAKQNAGQEDVLEYLQTAEEELNRIAYITRQTLGFYGETERATEVRLGDLLDSSIAFASRIRNKGVQIRPEVRHDPEIRAVRGEIRQLMSNLLSNSIDAVDANGCIRIRISEGTRWHGDPSHGVKLVVADSGSGIPENLRANLFEPFFTTKTDVGTGLGLWICKNIVDKHGGSIRVKSSTKPGKSWTAVSVFLPTHPEAEVKEELQRALKVA